MKKFINFVKHPLFSGSMIMIAGSNAVSFLNYLYHFIIGRLLGPSNYGELAAIISLIGLLGIIPGSVTLVITKYVSAAQNDTDLNNLIFWFKKRIIIISLIYTIILLALTPLMTSFLKIPDMSYLIMIAISFLLSLQSSLNRAILQGLLKFKEMISSILAENGAKLIISVILVYLGFQVAGAVMAFVIASFLGFYMTIYFLKTKYQGAQKEKSPNIKAMAKFAIPVAIQSFAVTSLYSSDVILVKHFFSPHQAGVYAALSILGKIIFFGAGPIGAVMFPLVSKRHSKGESYKSIFIYSLLATLILIIVVLTLYLLAPQLAIMLLYGKAYLEAANLLVWFGIFISLFTISTLFISYYLSLGKISVVALPCIAAVMQIVLIWFYHQNLFMVILISIILAALLLVSLLIYSIYGKRFSF